MKISIVMPTYKRAHTINRAIETIQSQTHTDWELIIVDNAGDGGYEFSDSRIRVIVDSAQTSACYARNQGIAHATGELICFFDDDDEMFPNYLSVFVEVFDMFPRVKMVRAGMVLHNGHVDYSYGTAEVCLRRLYATPTWAGDSYAADQRYFRAIEMKHHWKRGKDVIAMRVATCRANTDPRGGMREGKY